MNYFLRVLLFVVPSTIMYAMDAPSWAAPQHIYLDMRVTDRDRCQSRIKVCVRGKGNALYSQKGFVEVPLQKYMNGKYYRGYVTILVDNAPQLKAIITYSDSWNYVSAYLINRAGITVHEERKNYCGANPAALHLKLQLKKRVGDSLLEIKTDSVATS